jgi:hypothetical protein
MAEEMTPGQRAYAAYEACRKGLPVPPGIQDVLWRGLDTSEQRAWEAAAAAVRQDIHAALGLAVRYGQIDGDHHKAWVIDQMCRALLGTTDAYTQFIHEACTGDDGPDTYGWNTGIAP